MQNEPAAEPLARQVFNVGGRDPLDGRQPLANNAQVVRSALGPPRQGWLLWPGNGSNAPPQRLRSIAFDPPLGAPPRPNLRQPTRYTGRRGYRKVMNLGDYQLHARFDELRAALRSPSTVAQRQRPLAYWALPSDRRLPHALLGETVDALIRRSFNELARTPGVGPKKMEMLLELLERAAREPAEAPPVRSTPPAKTLMATAEFDAQLVSESDWQRWQETVRRHALAATQLGQITGSLRELPTALWNKTLGEFQTISLAELRARKTFGEKRVSSILQIFHRVHSALADAEAGGRLVWQLRPLFVLELERWFCGQYESSTPPALHELRAQLVLPLLNQIAIDGGETLHQISAGRLGIEEPPASVRQQARRLNVTRARIYQLYDTCQQMMRVRWPEGFAHFRALRVRFPTPWSDAEAATLFAAAQDHFYPGPPPSQTTDSQADHAQPAPVPPVHDAQQL